MEKNKVLISDSKKADIFVLQSSMTNDKASESAIPSIRDFSAAFSSASAVFFNSVFSLKTASTEFLACSAFCLSFSAFSQTFLVCL